MRFAKIVFRIAGIYGFIVLLPQYFTEDKTGRRLPSSDHASGVLLWLHRPRINMAALVYFAFDRSRSLPVDDDSIDV
jgi:hypothetical protein